MGGLRQYLSLQYLPLTAAIEATHMHGFTQVKTPNYFKIAMPKLGKDLIFLDKVPNSHSKETKQDNSHVLLSEILYYVFTFSTWRTRKQMIEF